MQSERRRCGSSTFGDARDRRVADAEVLRGWKRDETICERDKLELATADDPVKKVMCKAIDWMDKKEADQDGELERCTTRTPNEATSGTREMK